MEPHWFQRVPSGSDSCSGIPGCPFDATGWEWGAKLGKGSEGGSFKGVFVQKLSDPRPWPGRHFPWRSEYPEAQIAQFQVFRWTQALSHKRLALLDDLAGRPTGARVAGWPVGFVPLVPECAQGAEHPN